MESRAEEEAERRRHRPYRAEEPEETSATPESTAEGRRAFRAGRSASQGTHEGRTMSLSETRIDPAAFPRSFREVAEVVGLPAAVRSA